MSIDTHQSMSRDYLTIYSLRHLGNKTLVTFLLLNTEAENVTFYDTVLIYAKSTETNFNEFS